MLTDLAQELKATINLEYLLTGVVKRKLLTDGEVAKLRHPNKSSLEKNDQFLNILKTKGSKAFAKFMEALNEEKEHLGHEDLYERLLSADEKTATPHNAMSRNSSQSSVTDSAAYDADYSSGGSETSLPPHQRKNPWSAQWPNTSRDSLNMQSQLQRSSPRANSSTKASKINQFLSGSGSSLYEGQKINVSVQP